MFHQAGEFFHISFLKTDTLYYINQSEVNKEKGRIELETKNMSNKLADIEAVLKELEDKNEELLEQINHEKMTHFDREKDFNDLSKQYELEKEKETVLQNVK